MDDERSDLEEQDEPEVLLCDAEAPTDVSPPPTDDSQPPWEQACHRIAALWPGFAPDAFRAEYPEQAAALDDGADLWPTVVPVLLERARREGEQALIERVQRRNAALPRVLSAGRGDAPPDYAGMSDEAFRRTRADYEHRMRQGQRVKP